MTKKKLLNTHAVLGGCEEKLDENSPRQLVTFALFTYNQEKFVREAVEAIFAQTYEPLEIILSDDCSTDRTLEIMQEMAGNYKGSKKILVRQTAGNKGTLLHVAEVAKVSQGELIILAAGDDVSKSNRTEKLVKAWRESSAWGVYSKFDRINEVGNIISCSEESRIIDSPKYRLRQYFSINQDKVKIIHGATSAYDVRLFDFLNLTTEDYILSEDGALSVLLNLLDKKIVMVDDSLVYYRENEQSLTNKGKMSKVSLHSTHNDELAIERGAKSQANRCGLFIRINNDYGKEGVLSLNTGLILADKNKHTMRARWYSAKISEKIIYVANNIDTQELKWIFPRMLPRKLFILIKTILKYLVNQGKSVFGGFFRTE